ncbi:antitoxin VapB family protein [Candidatus Pacearchaeota archaeon]|nr:antitoxin VapB family protein [Candidatus Pacearchaeota archaeon]
MGTKNISIMEDVYRLLLARKIANESFSDVIRRELKRKRNIMEFAGAWKDLVSDKEAEGMKKAIMDLRKKSTQDLLKNDIYR